MPVFNFHEHPNAYTVANCRDIGCEKAVLLPVGAQEAAAARDLAQKHPGMFVPFHWVDLDAPVELEVEKLRDAAANHGVRGIKFQPMVQHF